VIPPSSALAREREREEEEEEENIKIQYTHDCQRLYQSCSIITEEMTVRDPVSMIQVTADGETLGEVMIRGNNVMKGYLFNKQATHDSLGSDWFKTGDLAVLHRNGRIELKDRSKDIIISGGENISSIEVENAIITHNCVQEVAVIAIEDKMWGEVPCCFVVCVPGKSVTDQELEEWARTILASFKIPKKFIYVDSLPKTVTGKLQKHILRQQMQS